jgi:hypothetical protein
MPFSSTDTPPIHPACCWLKPEDRTASCFNLHAASTVRASPAWTQCLGVFCSSYASCSSSHTAPSTQGHPHLGSAPGMLALVLGQLPGRTAPTAAPTGGTAAATTAATLSIPQLLLLKEDVHTQGATEVTCVRVTAAGQACQR